MIKNKPDYYNDLDKIFIKIWHLLKFGLGDRDASFHIPTFICGYKNDFDGRKVVLRGIDEKKSTLWFHSDLRSKKIEILKSNPKCSLLFYDKIEKIQLRIIGSAKINYQNSFTENSWKKTAHMSRQCYLGDCPPGSDTSTPTSGLTEDVDNLKYSLEESDVGYKNFCVVEIFITSIEWLYLAAKGHRRAFFSLNKKNLEKKWLIP